MLELRKQMHAYRFPSDERVDPTTLLNGQATISLPFGEDAWLVYSAYQQHGTLPRAGGILDQPRAFKRLLTIMNSLYVAADEHEHLGDAPLYNAAPSDGVPRSFSDFARRG